MRIDLVPHDPVWRDRFLGLGAQLRDVFGEQARRIDHIGSTAVPGLAAKPIIDVQVSVASLDGVERLSEPLADLGFELYPNDDQRKRYARRRAAGREANVHIRIDGEFSQQAVLLLRDYLRADASARARYEAVKTALAEREWDLVDDYADAKGDVIWQLLREADRWSWSGWELGPTDA